MTTLNLDSKQALRLTVMYRRWKGIENAVIREREAALIKNFGKDYKFRLDAIDLLFKYIFMCLDVIKGTQLVALSDSHGSSVTLDTSDVSRVSSFIKLCRELDIKFVDLPKPVSDECGDKHK